MIRKSARRIDQCDSTRDQKNDLYLHVFISHHDCKDLISEDETGGLNFAILDILVSNSYRDQATPPYRQCFNSPLHSRESSRWTHGQHRLGSTGLTRSRLLHESMVWRRESPIPRDAMRVEEGGRSIVGC